MRLRFLTLLMSLLLALLPVQAHAEGFSEAEIKGAYLYNFAFYIQWPQTAFVEPATSLQYCVFDKGSEIAKALAELFSSESNTGQQFELNVVTNLSAIQACQLLFIDQNDTVKSNTVIAAVADSSVLTVSDRKGFAQKWGMVELRIESGRIRPIINTVRLSAAKLSASSKLLRLVKLIDVDTGN